MPSYPGTSGYQGADSQYADIMNEGFKRIEALRNRLPKPTPPAQPAIPKLPGSSWRIDDGRPVLGFQNPTDKVLMDVMLGKTPEEYKRTTTWAADPEGGYGAGSIEGSAANYNPYSGQYYDPIVRDPLTDAVISGGNVYGINPDGSVNMQNMLQRRTDTGFENLPGSDISGGGGLPNAPAPAPAPAASYEYTSPTGAIETRTPEEGQDQIRTHPTNPEIRDVYTFLDGGWHYRGNLGTETPKAQFVSDYYNQQNAMVGMLATGQSQSVPSTYTAPSINYSNTIFADQGYSPSWDPLWGDGGLFTVGSSLGDNTTMNALTNAYLRMQR